jgi:hypothetical protein
MYETHFMGKPTSYWLELDSMFGEVSKDLYVQLVATEAKIALLESHYENDKHKLETKINNLRKQLGFVNGE